MRTFFVWLSDPEPSSSSLGDFLRVFARATFDYDGLSVKTSFAVDVSSLLF